MDEKSNATNAFMCFLKYCGFLFFVLCLFLYSRYTSFNYFSL